MSDTETAAPRRTPNQIAHTAVLPVAMTRTESDRNREQEER